VPSDPIVDEIRRVREQQAGEHGFDVKAIVAASKKGNDALCTGCVACANEEVECLN